MTKRERAAEMHKHGVSDDVIALALQVRHAVIAKWRAGIDARGRPTGLQRATDRLCHASEPCARVG
jgi:hypothetical protein